MNGERGIFSLQKPRDGKQAYSEKEVEEEEHDNSHDARILASIDDCPYNYGHA